MEETLKEILRAESPQSKCFEYDAAWADLPELARGVIKKYSDHFTVVDAANRLSFKLQKIGHSEGMLPPLGAVSWLGVTWTGFIMQVCSISLVVFFLASDTKRWFYTAEPIFNLVSLFSWMVIWIIISVQLPMYCFCSFCDVSSVMLRLLIVGPNIEPNQYMAMYSFGVYLIKSLKVIILYCVHRLANTWIRVKDQNQKY